MHEQEAIEMIRKMDMEQVENQFVLQCAPLIAGLKCPIYLSFVKTICRDCVLSCKTAVSVAVSFIWTETN
ncbi:MAG: hypothetical protein ACLSD6_07200 [Clostridium sp.]